MRKRKMCLAATVIAAFLVFISCEKEEDLIVESPLNVNKAFVDEDFPGGFLNPPALKAAGQLFTDVIDYVDGAVPGFVSAPNYGTVSYDTIHNHSTTGTGSVKLASDTSDIARMWVDLATLDSLLTFQYLGSNANQVIGIGVGNISENEYKFTGYIDSDVTSQELAAWREFSYDWYAKIEQYVSSDPDWDWWDDFAVVIATNDYNLYIDKYQLANPKTATPSISGPSSISQHQENEFCAGSSYDYYEWDVSGAGYFADNNNTNQCEDISTAYGSITVKLRVRDDGESWSSWALKSVSMN